MRRAALDSGSESLYGSVDITPHDMHRERLLQLAPLRIFNQLRQHFPSFFRFAPQCQDGGVYGLLAAGHGII
jgi:hypothetical protein